LIKGNVSRIGITLLSDNLVYINGFPHKIKTLKNRLFDFALVFGN
jgi:hypothetical protein